MTGETLKTVEKALQVLRAFDRASPELSVAEISRRLGVSRTAITRILATLERPGFLERSASTGRYRIGIAACEVGALYLIDNPLTKIADEAMQRIAQLTGFTAYLGKLYGDEVVILGVREGTQPIRFLWSPGDRLPVGTTALGKAMLMAMPESEIDQILGSDRLAGLTPGSLATRADLDRQLAGHRGKGWVPMAEESYPGICGVGAAIVDGDGAPLAGISLSFLGSSREQHAFDRFGAIIVEAAREISRKLQLQGSYARPRRPVETDSAARTGTSGTSDPRLKPI
jgi:DNA-binding IclR family transcriptional regulator